MANINDLKQSKFLTKSDVMTPILVTIRGYDQKNVAMEGAEAEMKYALHFNEVEKPLILNSTNGQIIASITGSGEFDDWIGKKVVLYNDPNIFFGGKQTGGIRVRAPKPQAATGQVGKAPPPPPPMPTEPDPNESVPF